MSIILFNYMAKFLDFAANLSNYIGDFAHMQY